MIFVKPEQGIGDKIIAHLVAPVIVDEGSPLRMRTEPGILVFIEGGAVEIAEAVAVLGEMGRHPVEDDPDVLLMTLVDEVHEILRDAVSAGDAEGSGDLIAPGFIEGMFHDRHQLNMGESKLCDVGDKLVGKFPEGQEALGIGRDRAARNRGGPHKSTVAGRRGR